MSEIFTEIEIAASADEVWSVLTNFDAYPEWNSMMRPEGREIGPGAQLRVRVRINAWLRFSFRPTIRTAAPGRELSWNGRLPARMLQGIHSFTIEPRGKDRARFVQREVFSGWLATAHMWLMGAWAKRAYAKMNQELKARAELICERADRKASLVPAEPSALTSN